VGDHLPRALRDRPGRDRGVRAVRASDIAYALFSFPSFADYERYRARFGVDPEFVAADRIRDESGCVRRLERSFLRPLLP
jgi:NIPSNAP